MRQRLTERDINLDPARGVITAMIWSVFLWVLVSISCCVHAAVPEACRVYQRHLTSEAMNVFGPNAPIAVLAAQIQQESGCRANAVSPVGARGLTQFMPATAQDMARRYPQLGAADPMNWRWAIQAQVLYMAWLTQRNPGKTECDTFAFGFASYNGGEGWLRRDQAVCDRTGPAPDRCGPCDSAQWFGHVATTPDRRRAAANIRENRGYPERILLKLTPQYVAAGYGHGVGCTP